MVGGFNVSDHMLDKLEGALQRHHPGGGSIMAYTIQIGLSTKTVDTQDQVDEIVSLLSEVGIPTIVELVDNPALYCPWGHGSPEGALTCPTCGWKHETMEELVAQGIHTSHCTCLECMAYEGMREAGEREEGERLERMRNCMVDGLLYTASDLEALDL
jgi:hypothetical protein